MKYHTRTKCFEIDTATEKNHHGTEGAVYLHGATAIKLYFKPTEEQRKKLEYLIAHRPSASAEKLTAWPQEIVYDSKHHFVGYTMRKIEGHIFSEITERFCTLWSEKYLIAIALSLIYCVDNIHKMGYCIGDFNPNNFLVNASTGQVIRLDIDSLHIEEPNMYYPCGTLYPDYTAPEILYYMKKNHVKKPAELPKKCSYNKQADLFALYALVFRILNKGYHPCTAVPKQTGSAVPSIIYRIRDGIRPYFTNNLDYKLPDYAPPLTHFSISIRMLFQQCFNQGFFHPNQRPSAQKLYQELNKLYRIYFPNQNVNAEVSTSRTRAVKNIKAQRIPKSPKIPKKTSKLSLLKVVGQLIGVFILGCIIPFAIYIIFYRIIW